MNPAVIVHGGAGDVGEGDIDAEPNLAGCRSAARAGFEILRRGGCALDAVVAAVVCLEDDPLFNAGTGSALTLDGQVECDASLMRGDGGAGAVAGVRDVKNPIRLARLVMERTSHVLLTGAGAEELAAEVGRRQSAARSARHGAHARKMANGAGEPERAPGQRHSRLRRP
jgi:L-asparaginase / beta-aspartyl-peptidase